MFYFFFSVVLLPALAIFYVIYQRYLHPLAGIPGPFWASLSRLWLVKHCRDGDMHRVMIALHERHGKLIRIGPNELSIADIDAIKTVYAAGTKFRKSEWYGVWQGHRKFDLFAERDERLHGQQRRLVSRPYSMESLKDLEPYVDDAVRVFLSNMEKSKGQSIDMGNWVQLFAFDVIGEVTFSKPFGFMENGRDDGSFKAIQAALWSASWLGQVPWVYWMHDRLMPYIGNHLSVNNRHGGLRTFAATEVSSRKERGSGRKDILSKLFTIHDERPGEFDHAAVVSMATSNIFAGSDTTAVSTRAIIYYLLKNPLCKQKLIDEIDTFRAQGKISDPVSLSEADNMPYLQAVMWEALRCHPAVGLTLARVVPSEGATIDGHFIPSGTIVGANPWVVHRIKDIYGEDVGTFRPERWLEDKNGDKRRYFLTFGAGARMCLGRNISWMEMSKLIPTLFMHYEIELTNPEAEWTEKNWWFVMQSGVNCILQPRKLQV
ncbi:MAG: hypothetical protein M1820_001234 [Bogoriella megaspora]|nr:MAG: hypothetical protein M1820_001234 [Bogoriella megaspora]